MKSRTEFTTIALKKRTVDKLKSLGKKGETYDDVIQRLLSRLETIDPAFEDAHIEGVGPDDKHR